MATAGAGISHCRATLGSVVLGRRQYDRAAEILQLAYDEATSVPGGEAFSDFNALVTGFAKGLFDVKNGIHFLGQLGDQLTQPLPIVKKSVAQLLGIGMRSIHAASSRDPLPGRRDHTSVRAQHGLG